MKKTLWGYIFKLKIVIWMVFRDGRNYRMCCILTSVDKIFYNFLKSILEKKCNGIFWKKTLWGYIFRLKIVFWIVFRDGRNYGMCCILTSGNKIIYIFLKSILEKNVMEYSEWRIYEDTYSDSKLLFEWSLETAEIIECVAS